MDFDFSVANRPMPTAAIALKTVYLLHADRTYDVKKKLAENKELIALRTFGGEGKVVLEGLSELRVTPGSLIFFEHKQVRRYYCSDTSWDFWWFEFSTDKSLNLPLNCIHYIDFTGDEPAHCISCLELLRKGDNTSSLLASSLLSVLLYTWQTIYKSAHHSSPHEEIIHTIIEYMRGHIHEATTIKDLASIAGFSERRFRQIFEEVTGTQPKLYYDRMRIDISEVLLRNTSLSIAQIAERLGFSSQFHFTNMFQKKNNETPSKFRKGL